MYRTWMEPLHPQWTYNFFASFLVFSRHTTTQFFVVRDIVYFLGSAFPKAWRSGSIELYETIFNIEGWNCIIDCSISFEE
jgi:hypothetical protein